MNSLRVIAATALIAFGPDRVASSATAPTASGWVAQQAPGYYRFRVGEYRVTVLSDGTAERDLVKIMSNPDAVRSAFESAHEALPAQLSINTYLVDMGDKRILIDTGAGELFGATSGHLIRNLRAAGYEPEAIDAILLTHIHGDHSGGLSIGGRRVFPNATVYVDRRDREYWLSTTNEANVPATRRRTFEQSHQTIDPYVRVGKLKTFDGATTLFGGIRSVPEYGHTPGLSGYMVESHGQSLLLWGDIIHAAEVQFADPAVTIDFDVHPAQAIRTRERVLQDAAERGYLVAGAHLSFPGLGHVSGQKGHFVWVPLPYQANL